MGDRANVKIIDGDGNSIFLYTHWAGYELPETVQKAMIRGHGRWSDESYLTRIIFCQMVGDADAVYEETGFGISVWRPSPNVGRTDLVVNVLKQRIEIGDDSWPFEQYCNTPIENIRASWNRDYGEGD